MAPSPELSAAAAALDVNQDEEDLMVIVREYLEAPVVLPWTQYQDEEGNVYFYNLETRVTSWNKPGLDAYIARVAAKRSERGAVDRLVVVDQEMDRGGAAPAAPSPASPSAEVSTSPPVDTDVDLSGCDDGGPFIIKELSSGKVQSVGRVPFFWYRRECPQHWWAGSTRLTALDDLARLRSMKKRAAASEEDNKDALLRAVLRRVLPYSLSRRRLRREILSRKEVVPDFLLTGAVALFRLCRIASLRDCLVMRSVEGGQRLTRCQDIVCLDIGINSLRTLSNVSLFCRLRVLNCSSNALASLPSLSGLSSLVELDASNNQLTTITDLYAPAIRLLNVSANRLSSLQMGSDAVLALNAQQNRLENVVSLEFQTRLHTLQLGGNMLSSIVSLPLSVVRLCVVHNRLSDLSELQRLTSLSELKVDGNPLTKGGGHRWPLLASLSLLSICDGIAVKPLERDAAVDALAQRRRKDFEERVYESSRKTIEAEKARTEMLLLIHQQKSLAIEKEYEAFVRQENSRANSVMDLYDGE